MKKREIQMNLGAIYNVFELRDLTREQKLKLIANKSVLEGAYRDYLKEIEPKSEGKWAELEEEMRKRGDTFYRKHKTDIDNQNKYNQNPSEAKIPPQLMDEWMAQVQKEEESNPEGAAMKRKHIDFVNEVGEQEVELLMEKISDTNGLSLKEIESLSFMFE